MSRFQIGDYIFHGNDPSVKGFVCEIFPRYVRFTCECPSCLGTGKKILISQDIMRHYLEDTFEKDGVE